MLKMVLPKIGTSKGMLVKFPSVTLQDNQFSSSGVVACIQMDRQNDMNLGFEFMQADSERRRWEWLGHVVWTDSRRMTEKFGSKPDRGREDDCKLWRMIYES
jgi:hypothetical protein